MSSRALLLHRNLQERLTSSPGPLNSSPPQTLPDPAGGALPDSCRRLGLVHHVLKATDLEEKARGFPRAARTASYLITAHTPVFGWCMAARVLERGVVRVTVAKDVIGEQVEVVKRGH